MATKKKAEVKTVKAKKVSELKKFKVTTSKPGEEMILFAKDKNEAEETGHVLFLQHGHYNDENPPVIKDVELIDESEVDE